MRRGPAPILTQEQVEYARSLRRQRPRMPYRRIAEHFQAQGIDISHKSIYYYINNPLRRGRKG